MGIKSYTHFLRLSDERKAELDALVEKWRFFFEAELYTYGSRMTFASERLVTSAKNFGLQNDDEKLYFYANIIDPEFLFLEAYVSTNNKDDFKKLCINNFSIYYPTLAKIENAINKRFKLFDEFELIERNAITKNKSL